MPSCRPCIVFLVALASFLCCCTPVKRNGSEGQQQKISTPQKEMPLPPGSANIEAWVQDYREEEGSFVCKIKICEVNGYGPATPPLPQDYILTLYVPISLLAKNKYDPDKIFVRGKLMKMSVRYQRTLQKEGPSDKWIATGFSNSTK